MKNVVYFINQQIQNHKNSLLFGHYSNTLLVKFLRSVDLGLVCVWFCCVCWRLCGFYRGSIIYCSYSIFKYLWCFREVSLSGNCVLWSLNCGFECNLEMILLVVNSDNCKGKVWIFFVHLVEYQKKIEHFLYTKIPIFVRYSKQSAWKSSKVVLYFAVVFVIYLVFCSEDWVLPYLWLFSWR